MHTSNVVLDCQGAHNDPQNAIVGAVNDTTDHETIAAIAGGAAGVSIVPIRTSLRRPTRRAAALATVRLQWSVPGGVPQTQARIGSARAGYQTGQVDFFTLIDSLTSFQDARLKRYRAVRDYQQALADLERAVGQPISLVGAASEQELNPEK